MKWLLLVAFFVLGFLTYPLLCTPEKDIEYIEVPKYKVVRKVDSIPYPVYPESLKVDTIYIDTTQYTIPILHYNFLDSVRISYGNTLYHVPFHLGISGYVKEYSIEQEATSIALQVKKCKHTTQYIAIAGLVSVVAYLLIKGD